MARLLVARSSHELRKERLSELYLQRPSLSRPFYRKGKVWTRMRSISQPSLGLSCGKTETEDQAGGDGVRLKL